MATGVTNYQCPACNAPLHYAGDSGMLECEYCGKQYTTAEVEALYAEKEAASIKEQTKKEAQEEKEAAEAEAAGMEPESWSNAEAKDLKSYNCSSCGAELICDDTTAATSCPYCGNPVVMAKQFTGGLKPDLVLPFRLDKKAAKDALKAYYKGKRLLPKAFSSDNHIEEIKGVYVPFWLYDCDSEGEASYRADKIHCYDDGDESVTEVSHYAVKRGGNMHFERIPVDGSSKMPDAHMDAVEPFDYSELKQFSTAYLPGYMADKYDESAEECKKRAQKRARSSTENALRDTVEAYDSVNQKEFHADIKWDKVQYALMPVWMLSTKWDGQNFLFAMNGQTGKLIGDLPVDKGLYWSWFARIALITAAVTLAGWLGLML